MRLVGSCYFEAQSEAVFPSPSILFDPYLSHVLGLNDLPQTQPWA